MIELDAGAAAMPVQEPSALPDVAGRRPWSSRFAAPRWIHLALAVVILVSSTATITAMRRTSPTFDEITTMAGGARGWKTGRFDIMPNYPPVTQYLYGLPVHLMDPVYPQELRQDTVPHRYAYAQELLYRVGNDPERVAFAARLVAAGCAALLILLTFLFASRYVGRGAGLLAAALVAFLPDVLAHGGVAYNDIALAPAFLAGLWAIDAALRTPSLVRGAVAGALVSVAVGIKHPALLLGPIAATLLAMELLARRQRGELSRALPAIGASIALALVVGYLVQVALYQGDFTLSYLRSSTIAAQTHIGGGHGVPAYLLGRMTPDAPWFFYPVAFLYKTSFALHALIAVALVGGIIAAGSAKVPALLAAPIRAPLVAVVTFGAILLNANLVIGFRYALPLLPLICVLAAAGTVVVWRRTTPILRGLIVLLTVWSAASALSYYPHFLAYTSEYQGDPELGYGVFVDSSLDWGQGLLELRDFMREENVDRIYLSYFGSGMPEGYGIDYVAWPSFFPLQGGQPVVQTAAGPDGTNGVEQPRFAAVSATNLVGLYFSNDVFAELRRQQPYRVLGHTVFIYEVAR
jgi:4-amino-4-deoxy-L-arabinose transferase-like glycosyltransferase